jgi:hypothetical protein
VQSPDKLALNDAEAALPAMEVYIVEEQFGNGLSPMEKGKR